VFYCAVVLLGLGLWLGNWAVGLPSLQILALILLPVILAAMRGVLRLVAAIDLLPEWRRQLLAYAWAWTLLAPLVPFVYLYNSLVAAFSRKITWRGIRYELVSPRQTRILVR
jgi:ceramide glucosyltransferase